MPLRVGRMPHVAIHADVLEEAPDETSAASNEQEADENRFHRIIIYALLTAHNGGVR